MAMNDWWSCDGQGSTQVAAPSAGFTRRAMLSGAALAAFGLLAEGAHAIGDLAFATDSPRHDHVLVNVFLRGGADGLNVVVPVSDDEYYKARPTLAIPAKDTLRLTDYFGFHSALAGLYEHYRRGDLAVLHAVGSGDQTRSHFEAMNAMERGVERADRHLESGWLARYLRLTQREDDSPLRAVAIAGTMPDSLRGGSQGIAIESLDDFRLALDEPDARMWHDRLNAMYEGKSDPMSKAGRDTLQVLDKLRRMDARKDASKATYPSSDLGQALRQVAQLIRADVGLEIACVDKGGWDTHVAQGSTTGWLSLLLKDLSDSLAAFTLDLGSSLSRVTIVVQTEFGRRVEENSALGTDHGRGSFMFVLGGGVRGGRVLADWPGLKPEQREGPGDLRVTTDYRTVLAEIVERRLGVRAPDQVFVGLRPEERKFSVLGA